MLLQFLNIVLYELVICVTSVHSSQNVFLENGYSSERCQLPEIQTSYFENERTEQLPELITLNSTEHLNTEIMFPFQYILMTCSASYPVEWVGKIPKVNSQKWCGEISFVRENK